jgi:hypothetical protein
MTDITPLVAALTKPQKVLVLGAIPEIEDFVAWYLLYLIHGEDLVYNFAAEDKEVPDALLEQDYQAIFLLNHIYDTEDRYLQRTGALFEIDTHPFKFGEVYWQSRQKSHRLVFRGGAQEFSQILQSHETSPGAARRCLSSPLIDALTRFHLGAWWNRPESIVDSPVVNLSLALKMKPAKFAKLTAVLKMLDKLPSYEDRAAARLHDDLETLEPPSLAGSLTASAASIRIQRGFQILDEFFGREDA